MAQPDLDFTAPEVQITSMCSPLSDMFALGMLICSIFNKGKSLIEANHSSSVYLKQLEVVRSFSFNAWISLVAGPREIKSEELVFLPVVFP